MSQTVYFLHGNGRMEPTSDTKKAELWSKHGGKVTAITENNNE